MDAIISSFGPMTRSARDLALFVEAVLDGEPWLLEPQVLEIPWKSNLITSGADSSSKPLSIAILWDDGVVRPHPPITKALKEAESALISAGHDVIRWEPMGDHQAARDLICKLYFLDGAEEKRRIMRDAHDTPVQQTEFILGFAPDACLSAAEVWELHAQRDNFRAELGAHWLATSARTKFGRPVDAVLCPIAPTLAAPHDTTRWWGYSSYWNLADYPGVVFPVGRCTSAEYDATNDLSPPRNDTEEFVQRQWDPKTYENAPISLQLVARRLNEEKLLHALNVVEDALKLHTGHQRR
jgi:amidase